MTPVLRLELPSTFANLERVVEEVEHFLQAHAIEKDVAYRVLLLASEAVTNAMEHGNAWDAAKCVTFELRACQERIECTVSDEGDGYDLASVENPLKESNILRGHGRGLYFMQEMADEMHLERSGSCLRLVLLRAPAGSTQ